jgi:phospholipase C
MLSDDHSETWARAGARVARAVSGALAVLGAAALSPALAGRAEAASGIQKIQHVVMIMQENRSFDNYFGTYPGANGIPAGVCAPDPLHGGCVKPYHNPADVNYGGPHGTDSSPCVRAGTQESPDSPSRAGSLGGAER